MEAIIEGTTEKLSNETTDEKTHHYITHLNSSSNGIFWKFSYQKDCFGGFHEELLAEL